MRLLDDMESAVEDDEIEWRTGQLFAMVAEGLAAATAAFLSSDRELARRLIAGDQEIDALQTEIEELVHAELLRDDGCERSRLRQLLLVLRVAPELERSGDLVEHIAMRSTQGLAEMLPPEARGIVDTMGATGVRMWQLASEAFAHRDPDAADVLRTMDDELDDLHVQLTDEIGRADITGPASIEMGLLARFYERLGDHAVNIARHVRSAALAG